MTLKERLIVEAYTGYCMTTGDVRKDVNIRRLNDEN